MSSQPPPRKPAQLPKPYYQDSAVTIYHGDSSVIIPMLSKFDLLLTDPPYGINMDKGANDGGTDSTGKYIRRPKKYSGDWDACAPGLDLISQCINSCKTSIIWGGNYMSDRLPQKPKWLVWDKQQVMPTYSDAELAWTTLPGVSVRMFRYGGNKFKGDESRFHPTQKPLELMRWCISLVGDSAKTVLDPFAGSCTTGRAAKDLGKKCICIEREEQFCEAGALRMQQEVLL